MVVDIQRIVTADNVALALAHARAQASKLAVLCTHGVGSNFYTTPLFAVAGLLSLQGYSTAVVNNRGHDWLWMNSADRRWLGASHERFEDCVQDVEAGVAWLRQQGYERIVLAGHSLGCLKVAYAAAHKPELDLAGLALCSGPRLPDTKFWPKEMDAMLHKAEELMASGRTNELMSVPMPTNTPALEGVFTAATYVNKYGAGASTSILPLAARLRYPALVLAGSEELPQLDFARELQATLPNAAPLAVIDGADHLYTGRIELVADAIGRWLAAL